MMVAVTVSIVVMVRSGRVGSGGVTWVQVGLTLG